jgi:hypothetical protein
MKLLQISVFLENHPGQLGHACRALADAGLNIVSLCLADSGQFGVLRLLVEDHARAMAVLAADGLVARLTEVVAVEVPDRPGGLAEVLEAIQAAGINIEYMYAFTHRTPDRAIIVFRFAQPDAAIDVLLRGGFSPLDGPTLSRRIAEAGT